MKILTIIVTYNAMRWIDRCLASLLQSATPTDILVIDNGSTDGTLPYIGKRYPQTRLMQNQANLGFGQANNQGLRIALAEGYEAVFLLNQDAWISPDTLTLLAEAGRVHREYGILSPVQLDGSGRKPEAGFAVYTGRHSLNEFVGQEVAEVPFINAAIWFMPIATVRRVGLFSPLFYHYGEDKDYANRVRFHRLKVGYLPHARGCHDRGERVPRRSDMVRAEWVYHLSEYANVNHPLAVAFAYAVLAVLKKAFQSLLHAAFGNSVMYLGLAWRLVWQTPRVIQDRKRNRKSYL